MRVTCVVDNAARRSSPFWGEHGLAFLIENEGANVLFDVGQSGTVLLHNLALLEVDPRRIDALVLSHAHYDHTGGLAALLESRVKPWAPGLPLFAHPDLFRERFSRRGDALARLKGRIFPYGRASASEREIESIGLALGREVLAQQVELHLNAEPTEVAPGVWTTGEISIRPEPEGRSARHLVREGEGWAPDPYRDDQALVLKTGKGLVVLCGCCHAGLLNTLAHVRRTFGQEIIAVAGGTHLVSADEAQLRHVVAVLRDEYGSPLLHLNHCTGERAYMTLAQAFGERVAPYPAGTVLRF